MRISRNNPDFERNLFSIKSVIVVSLRSQNIPTSYSLLIHINASHCRDLPWFHAYVRFLLLKYFLLKILCIIGVSVISSSIVFVS